MFVNMFVLTLSRFDRISCLLNVLSNNIITFSWLKQHFSYLEQELIIKKLIITSYISHFKFFVANDPQKITCSKK